MNSIAINDFSLSSVKFRSILTAKSGNEVLDCLSNQSKGFPVMVNGVRVETVEHLYHALKFTDLESQKEILSRKTPSACKRIPSVLSGKVRKDWEIIKLDVMRYCLRVKLVWNSVKFGQILKSLDGCEIVCEDDESLGMLLMELRDEYLKGDHSLYRIEPPDCGLVFGDKNIYGRENMGQEEVVELREIDVIDRKSFFKNRDYVSPYEGMY